MGPRSLPPVNVVLARSELAARLAERGRPAVLDAVRGALAEARAALLEGRDSASDAEALACRALVLLDRREAEPGRLRPVLNATGIVVHTGLGRAPWAEEAVAAASAVARGYCNLEFDLEEGTRGGREAGVVALVRELTGAEAAAVVNNNAAATSCWPFAPWPPAARSSSRAGSWSRSAAGFGCPRSSRSPAPAPRGRHDQQDPARRLPPQRSARDVAAFLRVHPSNFRIVGFTEKRPPARPVATGARTRPLDDRRRRLGRPGPRPARRRRRRADRRRGDRRGGRRGPVLRRQASGRSPVRRPGRLVPGDSADEC